MICLLGVLLVVVAHTCVTSALPPCVCTRESKPVCGTDGRTYDNECLLQCQQHTQPSLQLASRARCRSVRETDRETCICTLEYDPVCGSDGRTYPNSCAMRCDDQNRGHVVVAYEGECRAKREIAAERICTCPLIYLPVCGTDGVTYDNECSLKCKDNVEVAYAGACRAKRQGCAITNNIAPVCGTNGVTYSNESELRCHNTIIFNHNNNIKIEIAHRGECAVTYYHGQLT